MGAPLGDGRSGRVVNVPRLRSNAEAMHPSSPLDPEGVLRWVAEATGAESVRRGDRIQSLWSGYGELFRVRIEGAGRYGDSVIVKWVKPPARARDDVSHARKCRSYDV